MALACLLAVSIAPTMAKGLLHKPKADPLKVPELIARYELAEYRKTRPNAELAVVFFDHEFANAKQAELRRRLGFANPKIREGRDLVTLRFGHPEADVKKLDASVLYGNPSVGGFRAHYTIKKAGKKWVIANRNVFLRY